MSNNILERLGRDVLDEFLRLVERKDTLFYKVNVHDLLWGYHDKTLQLLKDFRLTDNATFSVEVRTISCMFRFLYFITLYSKTTAPMTPMAGVQLEQVSCVTPNNKYYILLSVCGNQ